ncbi:MAG TPA: hypothetical protein VFU43_08490 [Streptosporangiaceae bacterium]|nr:hypothetical protein [Streptosporangiaceae bacterium]
MNLNSKLVTGICGVAAVAVIGTGGYLMGSSSDSLSSSSAASGASGATGATDVAGPARDDALTMTDGSFLDAALAAADEPDLAGGSDQPGSAAPEATAAPGDRHPRLARHPLRARQFLRGVHGTATVRVKDGGFTEVAWQRGQVTAVSGGKVTVRSADGATWQWVTGADTRVRRHGDKASASQLAANDRIFVIGTVAGSTRTARAAVVPKAR